MTFTFITNIKWTRRTAGSNWYFSLPYFMFYFCPTWLSVVPFVALLIDWNMCVHYHLSGWHGHFVTQNSGILGNGTNKRMQAHRKRMSEWKNKDVDSSSRVWCPAPWPVSPVNQCRNVLMSHTGVGWFIGSLWGATEVAQKNDFTGWSQTSFFTLARRLG